LIEKENDQGLISMPKPFEHDAASLHDFFSQGGRGFYIPYYQRPYSWDEENAKKLVDDILSSTKRTISKPNNTIFLGTVILHDEDNIKTNVHVDTQNLLTKIVNVVDGQQRLSSIAMLACVLETQIKKIASTLDQLATTSPELRELSVELKDVEPDLKPFYSIEISKTGAQPKLKPKIIRAGEVTTNPISDQWTLNGDVSLFYKSNTAVFLSKYINGEKLSTIDSDERVSNVIKAFENKFEEYLADAEGDLIEELINVNGNRLSSLFNFMANPPTSQFWKSLTDYQTSIYSKGMFLLAVSNFFRHSCYFVVIECIEEGLAFDMFQSLNATGTPLTAFEVFKPQVVQTWGDDYALKVKSQVDRIEKVVDEETNASSKEEVTDKIIVSAALTFDGEALSRIFSDERDWLSKTLRSTTSAGLPTENSLALLTILADKAEYYKHIIKPKKPKKNSKKYSLCNYLISLGLNADQADLAALCIYYLRDAKNDFAHSVLSVFYSKLLRAQSDSNQMKIAADEFEEICKATAAFFTLFMGAQTSRFPEKDYRDLFQSKLQNITILYGSVNQTASFVKDAYRKALESKDVYDCSDPNIARATWVNEAKEKAWYPRKAVCRFALLVSAHDAQPDVAKGNEGFFTDGLANSANLLNCSKWHSQEFEVIEHIATQNEPKNIKHQHQFDKDIYPGNHSVVDKLGNLTLLSRKVNSSVYSEWPDKVFYYWHLTTPQKTAKGPDGKVLMSSLGVTRLPPALIELAGNSSYLSHLAPIVHRGIEGKEWDAKFIGRRSEHLCQRIFDKLNSWLI